MIEVTFFQRRPRAGFNFSFEAIFAGVRAQLAGRIRPQVEVCSFYNDGWWTKVANTVEAALRQSGSVNHVTGEVHFLNLLMRKNTVVLTVHDCRFLERKSGWRRRLVQWLYLDGPVRKAKYVTTVSERTRRDVLRYTGCPAEKVRVIPVAVDTMYQPFPRDFRGERPRILQVGTGENKNLPRLIEALENVPCHLSIVGKLNEAQRAALENYGISYDAAYGLSPAEMLKRYHDCDIVSFVSTFEGFGMPIVEANCVERVVLSSTVSSMPEVAGEAALLVDPFDVGAIRRGILRLKEEAPLRRRLIEAGRRNKLRFQSDRIAAQYYDLYREIAERK